MQSSKNKIKLQDYVAVIKSIRMVESWNRVDSSLSLKICNYYAEFPNCALLQNAFVVETW